MFSKLKAKKDIPRLFFLHIPKTAGTSFVDLGVRWFGQKNSANYIEGRPVAARKKLGKKRFVSGHIFYDEMMRLPYIGDCKRAIFLRDPYARLASHLRYMDRYNQPEFERGFAVLRPELQGIVKKLAQVDFNSPREIETYLSDLTDWGNAAYHNCQTRFLVCDLESSAITPYLPQLPEHALEQACERLSKFDYLCLSEEFADSVAPMAADFGFDLLSETPRSNTESSSRKLDYLDPAIRNVLAPFLEEDVALYQFARKLFQEKRAAAFE